MHTECKPQRRGAGPGANVVCAHHVTFFSLSCGSTSTAPTASPQQLRLCLSSTWVEALKKWGQGKEREENGGGGRRRMREAKKTMRMGAKATYFQHRVGGRSEEEDDTHSV